MGKDVIVALDFDSKEKTLAFLDRFTEEKPFVKIGMELFYAEGPSIVREIRARGHKIFLDLKLHDIPNTVKRAMAVLSRLDVDMVNLHAAGARVLGFIDKEDSPLAQAVEERLKTVTKPITVAVMGCVVNGPGEASAADVGIAGGKGEGLLFAKGKVLRKVPENQLVDALFEEIDKL